MTNETSKRFLAREDGVSAIEFALLAPVLTLILIAGFDLGLTLLQRFELNSTLNAATSYVLANHTRVGAEEGSALASDVATLIAMGVPGDPNISVAVNNGPKATVAGNILTPSGDSSQADQCWCPERKEAVVDWGASRTCGSTCADGGQAGKFVSITVSRSHETIMFDFGEAAGGKMNAASMVRAQ